MNTLMLFLHCMILASSLIQTCQDGYGKINTRRRRSYSRCGPCREGEMSNSSKCILCPSGQFNAVTKQVSCMGSQCLPGKFGPVGARTVSETSCSSCHPGRFQDGYGKPSCHSCPSGKYQPEMGKTFCLGNYTCPAGKYGRENSTRPEYNCTNCPSGTYIDFQGATLCKPCVGKRVYLRNYTGNTACLGRQYVTLKIIGRQVLLNVS